MSYFIIENDDTLKSVIDYFIKKTGLPKIQRRLNIYSSDESGFCVEILNNKVYFKDKDESKFVSIKNKNLKHFFRFVQSQKDCGFFINDIVLFDYPSSHILFDTFHGNLLSIDDKNLYKEFKQNFSLPEFENINDHTPNYMVQKENLFDSIGNLNAKIKDYANKTGLDIRSSSSSIRLRLSNVSNDYSDLEKYFKLVIKTDLLSTETSHDYEDNFKDISIVVPSYNQNIIPALLGIESQNLSIENKQKIQVVLVDDGSLQSVACQVEQIKDKLHYQLDMITLNKNMGLSNARNVGLALAKHNLLLFMDSDIILSKNYLYDINIRLQLIPNSIFVAMRKNIEKDSPILETNSLLKGVEKILDFDDSRVITHSKEYHIGWDKAFIGETVSVLDDTNYFKQLSFGSKIGIYDLSSVVTGHNIALNKDLITKYPAFSNKFIGWGMEDSLFASTLISRGCYVIPVLSSCVFHINHPPRSGSMEQKQKEAARNYELYNQLLDEKWEG